MEYYKSKAKKTAQRKKLPKKIVFLYIIKLLYSGSSKEKPMKYVNIARALNNLGINYDRKTVSRDVNALINSNVVSIEKVRGGCYYDKEKDTFFNNKTEE